MTEQYLTVDQVAEILQLNTQTVRRMLAAGTLPGKKLGAREWRIARAKLDAFMGSESPTPPDAQPSVAKTKKPTAKKKAK